MQKITRRDKVCRFASTFLIVSAPAYAANQTSVQKNNQVPGGLETIVVSAQKRTENLQNVPISVTAVSGDMLKSAGIDSGADLQKITPNTAINSGSTFFSPYIRGVGTQYSNLGLESSIAVYENDIYLVAPQGGLTSYVDVKRIEVLKGPQGTLYGRNATGGAIRIITQKPEDQFGIKGSIATGSFDRKEAELVLNIPFNDTLKGRFVTFHDARNGYVHNIDPRKPNLSNRNTSTQRGTLVWTPNNRLTVTTLASYTWKDDSEGGAFINLEGAPTQIGVALGGTPSTGFYTTTQDFPDTKHAFQIKQIIGSLRVDYDFDTATVSSITGYVDHSLDTLADLDTVNIPLQHDTFGDNRRTASQEFQVVSQTGGPLNYVAGLYLFRESGNSSFSVFGAGINNTFGVPNGPSVGQPNGGASLNALADLTVDSYAPYTQITYDLNDQWQVLLGARYTWETKKLNKNRVFARGVLSTDLPLSLETGTKMDFREFTPKISINYKPNENVLLYLTYSKGFKSGGFNTPAFTSAADQVQPEILDAYEFGWKTESSSVRFNGSAFYYNYKNLQVQRTDQNSGGSKVENAASARIYGIETSVDVAVTEQFQIGFGGGLLQTQFKNYIGDAYVACASMPTASGCAAQGGLGYGTLSTDFSGNSMPQAPKVSGYVRGQYDWPLNDSGSKLRFNALLGYTDSFYYNPEHTLQEPEKYLLSTAITWFSPNDLYQVSLFGDNLLDEQYSILKTRQGSGGWRIPAPPATWGLRIEASY